MASQADAPPSSPLHLTGDGSLVLSVTAEAWPLVARWCPSHRPGPGSIPHDGSATIRVVSVPGGPPGGDDGELLLQLGGVSVRTTGEGVDGPARLRGSSGRCHGEVVAAEGQAVIRIDPGAVADPEVREAAGWDVYSMLTVSAALLLARQGRALVHAAAVVDPGGRAWLLVGDTHAGKTSTCVSLAAAGWGYLSDDQVVLVPGDDGVEAEGWLRPFHVDEGWWCGEVTGERVAARPERLELPDPLPSAPLGGLLFPKIEADAPTRAETVGAAEALSLLIRQSPWLLADRVAVGGVLDLLSRAASMPSHRLLLGRDAYGRAGPVLEALSGLVRGRTE